MKWTNYVKNFTRVLAVIAEIGIAILGFIFGDESDSAAIGSLIVVIGSIIVLLSFGIIMVICEISENTYQLNSNLRAIILHENKNIQRRNAELE